MCYFVLEQAETAGEGRKKKSSTKDGEQRMSVAICLKYLISSRDGGCPATPGWALKLSIGTLC